MLPFTLIDQPDYTAALEKLGPDRDRPLLVLYHGELARREFLGRVLKAAGYDEPGRQLHLLEWPMDAPLDLTGLVRRVGVVQVILFGYEAQPLGLHFTVANYFPITVGGTTYLFADSLEFIEQAKLEGDNRPAASLWQAIKQKFTKPIA